MTKKMNYYYITGTSRGIGKSLAENLLKDKNNFVTGISRSHTITNPNYKHNFLDLSNTEELEKFSFPEHKDAGRIVLVNNAGHLGGLKRAGNQNNKTIIDSFTVNLIAPSVLMNKFISAYKNYSAEKIIFNVTSGAARYPIDAESTYCASKAGLDMLSITAAEEQKITGSGFKIVSVGPGVVDTEMQKELREADEKEFSRKGDFIGYKQKGMYLTPDDAAVRFIEIIDDINKINKVVFSIREYEAMKAK
jgi:benzil reductase ((S)-benzoin forming)